VKRGRLEFLADNPLYTKRFAYCVGRRCWGAPIKEMATRCAMQWPTESAGLDAIILDVRAHRDQHDLCRDAFE
jgi:hypothetical protein